MRISVTSKAFSKNEYLIRLVPVENGKYAHHALVIFGRNMIEDFHPDGGGWKIPTNILYIVFNEKTSSQVIMEVFKQYDLSVIKKSNNLEFDVRCDLLKNPVQIAYELQKNLSVSVAEPDFAALVELLVVAFCEATAVAATPCDCKSNAPVTLIPSRPSP